MMVIILSCIACKMVLYKVPKHHGAFDFAEDCTKEDEAHLIEKNSVWLKTTKMTYISFSNFNITLIVN